MRCPTTQKLAAYHGGFVTDRERKTLAAHLAICEHCQHEMAMLAKVDRLLTAVPAPEMPADLWSGVAQRLHARRMSWRWKTLAAMSVAASLLVGFFMYHAEQTTPLPTAPAMATAYVADHQFLSAQDPLTDRASLGVSLAAYRSDGE